MEIMALWVGLDLRQIERLKEALMPSKTNDTAKSKPAKAASDRPSNDVLGRIDWNQLSKPQSNHANNQSRNQHKNGGKAR